MSTSDLHAYLTQGARGEDVPRLLEAHLETIAANDDHAQQKLLLHELIERFVLLERRVDALLRNTLPGPVADELKFLGGYSPRSFECSILFADVVGYTHVAEQLRSAKLIRALDVIFSGFDELVAREGGTKIKTIGDAYMAVFGAPVPQSDHPVRAVGTALEMTAYLDTTPLECGSKLQVRIGIHSGTVAAGVVGRDRMQFDVFGENVNVASRFESAGIPGAVNVSESTYQGAREKFLFEPRGPIALKSMADKEAYLVKGRR